MSGQPEKGGSDAPETRFACDINHCGDVTPTTGEPPQIRSRYGEICEMNIWKQRTGQTGCWYETAFIKFKERSRLAGLSKELILPNFAKLGVFGGMISTSNIYLWRRFSSFKIFKRPMRWNYARWFMKISRFSFGCFFLT